MSWYASNPPDWFTLGVINWFLTTGGIEWDSLFATWDSLASYWDEGAVQGSWESGNSSAWQTSTAAPWQT